MKTRKALKIMDFRKYLNWSYTPESPDFLRNQDFFRTFAPNILLAVFSDPNADPNGSGYLSVDKGQHGSYLPIQLEPDTVIYFYPW